MFARPLDLDVDRITVRVPQALALLGLGRSKLYELMGKGEIERIKVGKTTLIIVQSIHDFVERRRHSNIRHL
jgi:excisionase family DNA binding protein